MTERFRYPPKGYEKHIGSSNLDGSEHNTLTAVVSPSINNRNTLTSTVSQKIHLDRIQNEKGSDYATRDTINPVRPKSGRAIGIDLNIIFCLKCYKKLPIIEWLKMTL